MDLTQLVDVSVPLTTIFAMVVVMILYLWLQKQDAGTERMQELAHFIQNGAHAFLRREFLTIAPLCGAPGPAVARGHARGEVADRIRLRRRCWFFYLAIFIGMSAAVGRTAFRIVDEVRRQFYYGLTWR